MIRIPPPRPPCPAYERDAALRRPTTRHKRCVTSTVRRPTPVGWKSIAGLTTGTTQTRCGMRACFKVDPCIAVKYNVCTSHLAQSPSHLTLSHVIALRNAQSKRYGSRLVISLGDYRFSLGVRPLACVFLFLWGRSFRLFVCTLLWFRLFGFLVLLIAGVLVLLQKPTLPPRHGDCSYVDSRQGTRSGQQKSCPSVAPKRLATETSATCFLF